MIGDEQKLEKRRKRAVYEAVKTLLYMHAARFNKKHGNYLVRYARDNQVFVMDTWNGSISQGHCTTTLLNGKFGPEGQISYHTHIDDYDDRFKWPLEDGVAMYKLLLRSI